LRGLHFQHPVSQGKLVQALHGAIWDVAVDIRSDSPTFKQWVGVELTEANGRQLWIPPGFAHGFCVLSDHADVLYKCTDYYSPKTEHCIAWNDPELGVAWPVVEPMLSEKDKIAKPLAGQTVLPTVAEP
jgi:dTDP-4-dehydrorhamnose 3,5-epimerase